MDELVDRELAEPDGGSARIVAKLVGVINDILFKTEIIRIRADEIAYEIERSESNERILREFERRSRVT